MNRYIPPQTCPDEDYWLTLLEEGEYSRGPVPGAWHWVEATSERPYPSVWQEAETLRCQKTPLVLTIEGFNRGGLLTHWRGIECFVPASHLFKYPFPSDPEAREGIFKRYVGQELRLCVIEVEPARNRLLLSERMQECPPQPDWPTWLCPGNIRKGTVTSLRPFGAFVDLGPIEGMIHISEISWGRVRSPGDYLQVGDEVQVLIISADPAHQRVALSLKRLQPNPWDSIHEHIQVGTVMTGKLVAIEPFGLFVQLLPGIEGLVHVSELACEPLQLPQRFQVGQSLQVEILDLLPADHRITLRLMGENGHGGA